MLNSDLPEIKETGEKLIVKWLTENGYSSVKKETLLLHEQALKAIGPVQNILVQIRTFLHPNRPFKISDYEADILTRRAAKLNLTAYVAYVIIDSSGNLSEEINWERLS